MLLCMRKGHWNIGFPSSNYFKIEASENYIGRSLIWELTTLRMY